MDRLNKGFAGYVNPFGRQKYIVSLKPDDVICFVFWSKNYDPFIGKLELIEKMGYKFYFNYTITGLPNVFECNLTGVQYAIDTFKKLSDMYSPKHINWRYDPIVISNLTDYDFHLENFESIASSLQGYVERCYFSYVTRYGKVKKIFDKFQNENNVTIDDPDMDVKIKLANQLAETANNYGISMQACCGDYLIGTKIKKAHCIDGSVIEELFYQNDFRYSKKPTRKECGCTESTDIGTYDTCPHGCIYCYANINKMRAENLYENHDEKSAFLGYTEKISGEWINDIMAKKNEPVENKGDSQQLSLFD